jgi:xanthine dehydrogenase FAD-binding subunit
MIPFDFIYCRPDTLSGGHQAFAELAAHGKNPMYYAGGSEIITMSRAGSIRPGAVVDIKKIPECLRLEADGEGLHIGAACTLNQIKESKLYPLLALSCGRIADHTNQCRITLGGNLCGTIMYREISLPLLISDADISLMGAQGLRRVPFSSLFAGKMNRRPDELIVQLHIPRWALEAPYYHVKRTTQEKIDYPLVSMAALVTDGGLRLAFSGLCDHPFRSTAMEDALGDDALSPEQRIEKAAESLPQPAYTDVEGSGAYRVFVLKKMLKKLLEDFINGQV